jgi:hypothetical protein
LTSPEVNTNSASAFWIEKLLVEVRHALDMAYAEVAESKGAARGHLHEATLDLGSAVRSLERALEVAS